MERSFDLAQAHRVPQPDYVRGYSPGRTSIAESPEWPPLYQGRALGFAKYLGRPVLQLT
jgi:hypothetical protein